MVAELTEKMDKLIVVRHGSYGSDGRLNRTGRSQMSKLAEELQDYLPDGGTTLILSSTAPRALDSAEILAEILGVSVEKNTILWSENSHPEDFEAAHQLVLALRSRVNLGILMTHFEYVLDFPSFLGRRDLRVDFPIREIDYGRAVVINYRQKTVAYI